MTDLSPREMVKRMEAERERRIANWKRPKIMKAVTATAIAAAGLGVGLGILEARVLYFESSLSTTQDLIDKNKAKTEELELNLTRTKDQIGEACAAFLGPYITGGQIADSFDKKTDTKSLEEKAVDDGLREPNSPCGNSASTIRNDFESLNRTSEELKKTQSEMTNTLQPEMNNVQWELSKGFFNGPWSTGILIGCVAIGLTLANNSRGTLDRRYANNISYAARNLYTQELFDESNYAPSYTLQFTNFKIMDDLMQTQAIEQDR